MQLTPINKIKKTKFYLFSTKTLEYPNNKQGLLIIESPFLFSFGVSERKDIKSDELTGYCNPICLWEKNSNPKPEEFQFYEAIKK